MVAAETFKDLPCDCCGKPAVKWFLQTSVAICSDPACYENFYTSWKESLDEDNE